MKGDETEVVSAFVDWLRKNGWEAQTDAAGLDVLAERHSERLYCEAKGATSDPGTDIDIGYGQLLRRMPEKDAPRPGRYALVVRDEPRSVRAALRVTPRVRKLLRLTIYAVAEDGVVREI